MTIIDSMNRPPTKTRVRAVIGPLQWLCGLAFVGVVVVALWLRLHDLAARPMHADEANQAVKLGQLLETGRYAFDPSEHHGPTLYYFGLVPARFRGEATLAALTETTVRLTPALFGAASVLLLFLLARPLGAASALAAGALLALSPPAVYYSRYFVQETLLVTFTLAALVCGYRWWKSGGLAWAIGAGVGLGLMQATKATAPVFVAAALAAALIAGPRGRLGERVRDWKSLAAALGAATLVCGAFYSSFGSHWGGLRDALATYAPMLDKAVGGGTGHEKPWWYYGSLLVFRSRGGYIWDQTIFLLLAAAGVVVAARRPDRFGRFAVAYTLIVAAVLSLTPYKTPWLVINLVPGLCLLAGVALSRLRARIAVPLTLIVIGWLGWQTRQAVFLRPADPRNPYAYVQTVPDMLKVPALAAAAPPGPIKVISEEYWPLPWYLRMRKEVGYWTHPPIDCDGALVFASADLADTVRARLRGRYQESTLGLRPGFVLVVFTPVEG
jgi:uncharacterized protein (TIGR03663 family)